MPCRPTIACTADIVSPGTFEVEAGAISRRVNSEMARALSFPLGGFLFALSVSPKPWLMFDVGGDVGFYPSVRSYSAFVGMTIIPVVFWRSQ